MRKGEWQIAKSEGENIVAETVKGYVVDKQIAGRLMRFGIRKVIRGWTVDELGTGMSVNPGHGFGKRSEALEYVESHDEQTGRSLVTVMEDYLGKHPHLYAAEVKAFEYVKRADKPWPMKEKQAFVDAETKAGVLAEAATEKAGVEADVKVSESADVTAVEIAPKKAAEKPKAKPKRSKAKAKPKPAPKQAEEAAIEVSLDYMRQWCAERGNMVATQKREGCCIWVEGETKPYQSELNALGFRWGRARKGWYYDPKRAA